MFRKLVILALVGAFGYLLFQEYAFLRLPAAPMYNETKLFEKHYHISKHPPFVFSYDLLTPQNYQPKYKYPLVLVLPGPGDRVYAAYFLASDELRKSFPAFVVVPFTSPRAFWAVPKNPAYQPATKGPRLPDSLPGAMEIIQEVEDEYSIDRDKIYVTGHSTGGMGVYGAVARYPGIFAAAMPVAGGWDPAEGATMAGTPIWAFHGADDQQIPPLLDRQLKATVNKAGGHMVYAEIPGGTQDIWKQVYSEPSTWTWLFDHRRQPKPRPHH